jgi:hypothetical protein
VSKKHPEDKGGGYGTSPHMKGVALSILVIGVSITAIIIAWATIGYQGPSFSTSVMQDQQKRLREMYGLPPEPELSPEQLEVPPSLRNLSGSGTSIAGEASNSTNNNSTEDARPA